jgi:hypothetical protein
VYSLITVYFFLNRVAKSIGINKVLTAKLNGENGEKQRLFPNLPIHYSMKQKFSQSVLPRVLQVFLRIFNFFSPPQRIVENSPFSRNSTTIYSDIEGQKYAYNNKIYARIAHACAREKIPYKIRCKKIIGNIRFLIAFL